MWLELAYGNYGLFIKNTQVRLIIKQLIEIRQTKFVGEIEMANDKEFIHNLWKLQILLISNEVKRTYDNVDWDKLIELINVRKFSEEICDKINSRFP